MKRQFFIILIILTTLTVFNSCNQNLGTDIMITEYDELYDKAVSEGNVTNVSFDIGYAENTEMLIQASSTIIEGTIIKSEQKVIMEGSAKPRESPKTIATVKITKVLKDFNNLKSGDIIKIKQNGGFKFVQEIDGINYAYISEDYEKEYLKRDGSYLLFLFISKNSLENNALYSLTFPVQGQYKINKDKSLTAIEGNTLNIDEINAVRNK